MFHRVMSFLGGETVLLLTLTFMRGKGGEMGTGSAVNPLKGKGKIV